MDRRQANHLFWSPAGKFIVLAGLRQMNGVLEFIDTTGKDISRRWQEVKTVW